MKPAVYAPRLKRGPLAAVVIAVTLILPALAFAQAPPQPEVALKLPRDLSPWGMFMAADIVVKAVMIGLAFASVLTWTIWFAKVIELMAARRRLRVAIETLDEARNWSEASAASQGRRDGAAALIAAADTELRLSAEPSPPPA